MQVKGEVFGKRCGKSAWGVGLVDSDDLRQTWSLSLSADAGDGDWNDSFDCGGPSAPLCSYEWAVKNVPIGLSPGCNTITSPTFVVGPNPSPSWMRITISRDKASDSFPWSGASSSSGSNFRDGETEDYPVQIDDPTPTFKSSWGRVKTIYR